MEKCVIILDGVSEGKTAFTEAVKKKGYWVWSINHNNVLSMTTHYLGWGGERDKNYYAWLKDFEDLADKYWNFSETYVTGMIDKFSKSRKCQILIVHNCDPEIYKKLQEENDDIYLYNVLITDQPDTKAEDYTVTLDCKDENYINNLLEKIEIMTNKKGTG